MTAVEAIGGPDDGADLYPEDRVPCLVCGSLVGLDWDGVLTWHYPDVAISRTARVLANWCPGSRKAWEVPA